MDRKKLRHRLRSQTRRDLVKLATQLKIVGRHRMKKEQLVRAIAETRAMKKSRRPRVPKATRTTVKEKRIPGKNNRASLYPVTRDVISLKEVPAKAGQEDAELPRAKSPVSRTEQAKGGLGKLPGHRPELPGKVISLHIVPLAPAHRAGLAGHVPVKTGITSYSGIEEKGELPEAYGETKVILLPVHPYLIHAQWEISASDLTKARLRLGSDYERSRATLRFYDITDIHKGSNAHRHFDVEIDLEAKNWYVQLEMPGRSYFVDLGMKTEDGRFVPIGRSNAAEMPHGRPSEKTERTYMLVEGQYKRVEHISTLPKEKEETVDLTRMAEKLFIPGTSSKQ